MDIQVDFFLWQVPDLKEYLQHRGITCHLYRKYEFVKICELAHELKCWQTGSLDACCLVATICQSYLQFENRFNPKILYCLLYLFCHNLILLTLKFTALPVYRSWIWGWWCRRVKCTKLLQNRVVSTRKDDIYLPVLCTILVYQYCDRQVQEIPKSIPTGRSARNERLNPTLGCLN
jgi:hypothetical protein